MTDHAVGSGLISKPPAPNLPITGIADSEISFVASLSTLCGPGVEMEEGCKTATLQCNSAKPVTMTAVEIRLANSADNKRCSLL